MRFNRVAAITLSIDASVALSQFFAGKSSGIQAQLLALEPVEQAPHQTLITGYRSQIEKGGPLGLVFVCQSQSFVDRAHSAAAHVNPDIPQGVEHAFDKGLGIARCRVANQKEQIDI